MRRNFAIENVDITIGKQVAKMIVCPPVAETELKNMSWHLAKRLGGGIQTCPLRRKPPNNGIEPRHIFT